MLAVVGIWLLYRVGRWYAASGAAVPRAARPAAVIDAAGDPREVRRAVAVLLALVFSKYVYLASITSYFMFFLITKFGVDSQSAQLHLFAFLGAVAAGTFIGGPVGDRFGRKYVIWGSILGVLPFTLALPYADLFWTDRAERDHRRRAGVGVLGDSRLRAGTAARAGSGSWPACSSASRSASAAWRPPRSASSPITPASSRSIASSPSCRRSDSWRGCCRRSASARRMSAIPEASMRRALATAVFVLLPVLLLIARQQTRTETAMAAAAKTLLAALDADQRAKIAYAFDNDERQNWWFVPRNRNGLPLKEMTPAQRDAAFALLKTGLSEKGFSKAEAIRGLEPVLKAMENNSPTRDIERYFFTIFGEPGSDRWGWRYEGHHLSQNWTIVRGKAVSTTPSFFGANPAEVRDGPQKGQRALPVESDLRVEVLQVAHARAAQGRDRRRPSSPTEIITSNARKASMIDAKGLDMQSMTAPQRAMLLELIRAVRQLAGTGTCAGAVGEVRARTTGSDRLRLARRHRPFTGSLLPDPEPQLSDRVRQHPEQRQPSTHRLA